MTLRTAHGIGYGGAAGGACLALLLGLAVIPAGSWTERWVHVFIVVAVLVGVGAVIGLALIGAWRSPTGTRRSIPLVWCARIWPTVQLSAVNKFRTVDAA